MRMNLCSSHKARSIKWCFWRENFWGGCK